VIDPQRILVRCPNWLGDVVMSTPGLHALRERFPGSHIVAQLPAPLAPLLEGTGLVDEVWPLASRQGGLSGWRQDLRAIRAGRFELGVVIPESVSSALLMRLGGVKQVTGFARDALRRALLHEVVDAPAAWGRRRLVSKERFVLSLVSALGATTDLAADLTTDASPPLRLAVTETEEDSLAEAGVDLAQLRASPPVVLAPGAGFGDSKCWPTECFAELGDRLVAQGQSVLLLGAPGESEKVAAVARVMESEVAILDGVLDLGGLKALLRSARALVANDAGARHVAAAFGVPSVVFFGPTSVAKTADNLARVHVLETHHDCRPCYKRTCPIDHRCLRSISVETAFEAASAALEDRAVAGRGPA